MDLDELSQLLELLTTVVVVRPEDVERVQAALADRPQLGSMRVVGSPLCPENTLLWIPPQPCPLPIRLDTVQ